MTTRIALLLSALLALPVCAQEPAGEMPEEVVVVGRQPGPPLWRVSKGDNVLWIFAYLSPIPEDMEWEAPRVDAVIAGAQEYLRRPDSDIRTSPLLLLNPFNLVRGARLIRRVSRNPEGRTLAEVLPPELYERFSALKAAHFPRNSAIEEQRPLFAGQQMQRLIQQESGLVRGEPIIDRIERQVRRNRGIARTDVEVELTVEGNFREVAARLETLVASFDPALELACFESRLARMETDLDDMKSRAAAWAQGSVEAFRDIPLPDAEDNACVRLLAQSAESESVRAVEERTRAAWLAAAERALATNQSTFAVLDIGDLLREGGYVDLLRERGYEVREP